jgi:hypothetical protein
VTAGVAVLLREPRRCAGARRPAPGRVASNRPAGRVAHALGPPEGSPSGEERTRGPKGRPPLSRHPRAGSRPRRPGAGRERAGSGRSAWPSASTRPTGRSRVGRMRWRRISTGHRRAGLRTGPPPPGPSERCLFEGTASSESESGMIRRVATIATSWRTKGPRPHKGGETDLGATSRGESRRPLEGVFGHEPGGGPAWTSTRDPASASAGRQARGPDAGDWSRSEDSDMLVGTWKGPTACCAGPYITGPCRE